MRKRTKIHLVLLILTAILAFLLNYDVNAQPVAYARIVTDITIYSQPVKHTDTVRMEFVYFKDSVMVIMRVTEGRSSVQWIYPLKGFKDNPELMPTDFYTKRGNPVKIIQEFNNKGWLTVASIKFKSRNRMIYKSYPLELDNGNIVTITHLYEHDNAKDSKD